jgi:fused signal recognition particle receptor
LAARLKADGLRVLMAAADTFRAAAIEQLQEWGRRIEVDVIHQVAGADPAAVVFDAVKAATSRDADVLLVDTAGRLHTKSNLMDELAKLMRVVSRQLPGAPHEKLMVLDAPTGQNGLQQARMFHKAVGPHRPRADQAQHRQGGITIRIRRSSGLPIKLVGVGNGSTTSGLRPETFVDTLPRTQGEQRERIAGACSRSKQGKMPVGWRLAPDDMTDLE